MKCEVCGKEIAEGARFCPGCGNPVLELKTEPEQAEPNPVATNQQPDPAPRQQMPNPKVPNQPIPNPPVWNQPPQYQGAQMQKKKSKIWIPFVIGGAVLVIVILLVCALFIVKPMLEKLLRGQNKAGQLDGEAVEEIVEEVLGAEKLETTSFQLEYSKSGDAYELSTPDETGYVNHQYLDFDGDGEKELFVVTFEEDGKESYFELHMLEKTDGGEWNLADSISEYEETYLARTTGIACPERCDIYLGEADDQPVIYVEQEIGGSYFADGIGVDLYQICYDEETFQIALEPFSIMGSDVDYYLSLDKSAAEDLGEEDNLEDFKERFEKYGLELSDGMYYKTPLYEQNMQLTYVAGYEKYADFSFDKVSKWQDDGATGTLEGVVLEVFSGFQASRQAEGGETTESQATEPDKTTGTVTEAEWKNAYYNYLLSKDLSDYNGFSLLYVNDDDVPELYLCGNCEAAGQIYATYYNGRVNEQYLGRLGSCYGERQNIVINSDGHMGYYYDIFYEIQDGAFVMTHSGNYNEVYDAGGNLVTDSNGEFLLEYTWDNQTVTEQEYQNRVKEAENGKTLVGPAIQYENSGDILLFLQGKEVTVNNAEHSDDIFPSSSTSYLTEAQVAALTKEQLRIARNEIYARHGYIFKDAGLKAYFESKSWYVGTTDQTISDESLNAFEIANRDLIVKYEKQ